MFGLCFIKKKIIAVLSLITRIHYFCIIIWYGGPRLFNLKITSLLPAIDGSDSILWKFKLSHILIYHILRYFIQLISVLYFYSFMYIKYHCKSSPSYFSTHAQLYKLQYACFKNTYLAMFVWWVVFYDLRLPLQY